MVKKKVKVGKPTKKRVDSNWQLEDVQVHTGLPPQVEGQLRCFCRLSINQVLWGVPNPPDITHIRVKFWGEDGDGSLFRPADVKKRDKLSLRTTARYPVRSGPKQFASYLSDMSSLMLDVLANDALVPVGQAEVTQIGLLSPSRPINGFFPIFSPTDEKIGELQVSMVLESLMASYDSTGSIPTTDISMETYASHVTQESTVPKKAQPKPHPQLPRKPEDDPFISPASHQATDSRLPNGHSEDIKQKLNYSSVNDPAEHHYRPIGAGSTVAITTSGEVIETNINAKKKNMQQNDIQTDSRPENPQENQSEAGRDLLSVLLQKGNKLREEMIVSSLKTNIPASGGNTEENWGIDKLREHPVHFSDQNASNIPVRSSTGGFLNEVLMAGKLLESSENVDFDEKAVDLVFGNSFMDDMRHVKTLYGSPNSSISSTMDLASDPGDPIHSESLIQDLFYKNLVSETSDMSGDEAKMTKADVSSVEDPDNIRPPSRGSSMSSLLNFPELELETGPKKDKSAAKVTVKRKSRAKVKKRTTKRRRSSKSRSRNSGSDLSEAEQLSVPSSPRSETSRVSFDMIPSDAEEPPLKDSKKKTSDGLSIERLTLLGRVHVARITIDSLHLDKLTELDSSLERKKSKTRYGTKPPKPSPKVKKKRCTYFIEYQFPVVAVSRDKYTPNAMATEVMRAVSHNVKNNVVTFGHRSVFPVMFDGNTVEQWWKTALVFKIFTRSAGQKVPTLIGSSGLPLKLILKSENLQVNQDVEVRESQKNTSLNGSHTRLHDQEGLIGSLRLVIELASDHRDFQTALAKTRLAEMTGKVKIVPIPQTNPAPKPPLPTTPHDKGKRVPTVLKEQEIQTCDFHQPQKPLILYSQPVSNPHCESQKDTNWDMTVPLQESHSIQSVYSNQLSNQHMNPLQVNPEFQTLHFLLLIPEGRNFTVQGIPSLLHAKRHPIFPAQPHSQGTQARDSHIRNSYLVCRMFWCDDAVHSNVCWGSLQPQFNFVQIAPVLISQSLLERMRNNFMVVEIWDKKASAENDKLIGMVKLSLHQFYMSFRDTKIAGALLKAQYPVVAVDNFLPVIDPFTGSHYGQLKILLAMGSAEQVAALHKLKMERDPAHVPLRPEHYLERQDLGIKSDTLPIQIGTDHCVEHIFEVVVEGIRGLSQFENMIWGEADCFVQYYFPAQVQSSSPDGPVIKHAVPTLKSYRTATTLCISDPTFNDVTRHRIRLPQGVPVQRELLTACASAGRGGGGMPLEVWCRFYYPNVRDQCVAKASLPLAKLCAMITMQKSGEAAVQTFTLPLTQVPAEGESLDPEARAKSMESGLVDLTIHYKSQLIQNESVTAANKNLKGSQVCISVGVIRACGLKASAEAAAQLDSGMQYPSEVGVNAYVKIKLSFLGPKEERVTRTIARSFSPEFSHHIDFPCPLLWTEADSDVISFAELLETAEAVFEVWHQVPGLSTDLDRQLTVGDGGEVSGRKTLGKTGDVLLGMCTLSLRALLIKRTGTTGWFSINLPIQGWNKDQSEEDTAAQASGHRGLERVGGGLELSIKFAHYDDHERVIHAARSIGWSPVDLDVEEEAWQSEDESSGKFYQVSIRMDHLTFPLHNALIAGHNTLDKTTQCYLRYKFYDKAAVVTRPVPVSVNSAGYIVAQPKHRHQIQVADSSPFKWYLREERMEVQIWVSYGQQKEGEQRPKHRDKLIGSTYINLDILNDSKQKTHRISGMLPLFKPGAASLGGAYLRAHIVSKPQFGSLVIDEAENDMVVDTVDPEYDPDDSFHHIVSPTKSPQKTKTSPDEKELDTVDKEPTFSVHIAVERAMHLPLISDKNKSQECFPNSYVSFSTAESNIPSYTEVFFNSSHPVWDFEQETQLSTELLHMENKNLVFKVWHKPDGAPKSPDKLTDRVMGFVSVDLTPLASGLQQISGWYNIMDFNGQCKGQIKINVIPLETFNRYTGHESNSDVPNGRSSILNIPSSVPSNSSGTGLPYLPSLDLPHFSQHYQSVKDHHERLQRELQTHIQQFLQQHEQQFNTADQGGGQDHSSTQHWQMTLPGMQVEDSSSRSYMFSLLRRNLQDLDEITNKLKTKLSTSPASAAIIPESSHLEFTIPARTEAVPFPLTSTQSTIVSVDISLHSQRNTPRDDLGTTRSNEGESSSQMVVDSGAYSVENSGEKYDQDVLDSHRSCSDKIDTFRFGATPRDYVGQAESDSGFQFDSTPREMLNTGTSQPEDLVYTPRDQYSESGGFSFRNSPRENARVNGKDASYLSPRVTTQDEHSAKTAVIKDDQNSNTISSNYSPVQKDAKQMSVIQEFSEHDGSGSDHDEEKQFYHHYRDILSAEDEYSKSDVSDREEEGDIVVPRTLNDISGRFAAPGAKDPDFDVLGNPLLTDNSHVIRSYVSVPSHQRQNESDSDSDTEKFQKISKSKSGRLDKRSKLQERDSWLSDESDKETYHGENRYFHRPDSGSVLCAKYKVRQDSDTGYSSRDNISECFQAPIPAVNQSEIRSLRTGGHNDIDLENEKPVFDEKHSRHLLSNVDLDSLISGSVGTRDSGHTSRVSSAGSYPRQRTLSEQSFELAEEPLEEEEHDFIQASKPPDGKISTRGEELEDFFSQTKHKSQERADIQSMNHTVHFTPHGAERDSRLKTNPISIPSGDISELDIAEDADYTGENKTTGSKGDQKIPQFFMSVEHLQESMKRLQVVTSRPPQVIDPDREDGKAEAASEIVNKLMRDNNKQRGATGQVTAKGRQLPTAEETKRIAKIFSSKLK
ncbi:hypothetical protein CHS0354_001298 [Potamilus streckersoni]|uniref:C2 domain-containing protein n=1 Tax=Potamilus streckersoni TaxID=2493646 RepID=A0AAE0S388_9BIVA|nr:hypothetical protein CHS0354_001298 [Potamilus streckersoni]